MRSLSLRFFYYGSIYFGLGHDGMRTIIVRRTHATIGHRMDPLQLGYFDLFTQAPASTLRSGHAMDEGFWTGRQKGTSPRSTPIVCPVILADMGDARNR